MTSKEIANKWQMNRFRTPGQEGGMDNHEFYQFLQTDIDEYAISFLMHSEGCTREDAEVAYDKFIKDAK